MSSTSTFQCSPSLHRRSGETCLPESSLERLLRIWNKKYPRNKISFNATRKQKKSKQDAGNTKSAMLWRAIRKEMKAKYNCDTEYCAVKKIPGLSENEKKTLLKYFRPEKPQEWLKKPRTWLDSYNIEDVMIQYEQADPSFEFIGPVPIDFDTKLGLFGKCVVEELCKLDLKAAQASGKAKIGIIFNLDKHNEPGSHWVCAFINMKQKAAYYFDSYGYPPPPEVVELLKRCKDQGCEEVYFNDIRHQRKGSECGMYCLFVIICLLHNKPFLEICKNIIDDDTMNAFRDVLYATETPNRDAIEKAIDEVCIINISKENTQINDNSSMKKL